jgi:hypothetical protein
MTIAVVADPQYGPAVCHACGAAIVWALTDAGKRMPVDVEPVDDGALEIFGEYFPDGEPVDPLEVAGFLFATPRVRARPPGRPPSSPAWHTHWATCRARRRARRLPAGLLEQLRAVMARRWGPLFGRGGVA